MKLALLTFLMLAVADLTAQPGDLNSYYSGTLVITGPYDSVRFLAYANGYPGRLELSSPLMTRRTAANRDAALSFSLETQIHDPTFQWIRYRKKKADTMQLHAVINDRGQKYHFNGLPFTPGDFYVRWCMLRRTGTANYYAFIVRNLDSVRERRDTAGNIVYLDYYDWNRQTLWQRGTLDSNRRKTGIWTEYDANGRLTRTEQYAHGRLIPEQRRETALPAPSEVGRRPIAARNERMPRPRKPRRPRKPGKTQPPAAYTLAPRKTSFSIQNREWSALSDASLIINGREAVHVNGPAYIIDSLTGPPYDVEIRHPGYLTEKYHNLNYLHGNLHLRRKGEDFFYEYPMRIPCLRRRGYLLISMRQVDSGQRTIAPAEIRRRLNPLLDSLRLRVVVAFGDREATFPVRKGHTRETRYGNLFLVARRNGRNFKAADPLLEALRNSAFVEYAGPAVMRTDTPAVPFTLAHRLIIHLAPGIDTATGKQLVAGAGYGTPRAYGAYRDTYYLLDLPKSFGWEVVRAAGRLAQLKELIAIDDFTTRRDTF